MSTTTGKRYGPETALTESSLTAVFAETARDVLGIIAVVLNIPIYFLYFRSIRRGLAKPHAVSWGVWALLDWLAFYTQIEAHAGPACWSTGVLAALVTAVCGVGVWQRQVRVLRSDWLAIVGAAVAFVLLAGVERRDLAVWVMVSMNLYGYLPTARKVFQDPHSEDLPTYVVAVLRFGVQLCALPNFYTLAVVQIGEAFVASGFMTGLIWLRRRHDTRINAEHTDTWIDETPTCNFNSDGVIR